MEEEVKVIAIFFIFFFICFILFGKPHITDDGASYFALTKSLVEDLDFDLSNQRYLKKVVNYAVVKNPVTGRYVSTYSFGESLMQFVFFYPFEKLNNIVTKRFSITKDPYSVIEGLGILISSTIYGFLTVYLLYKTSVNLGETKKHSVFLALSFFTGTHLFFYTFSSPAYPHIYEAFLFSFLLFLFIKFREKHFRFYPFVTGTIYGLLFTVRNVNIVSVIPFCVYLVWNKWKSRRSIFINMVKIVETLVVFMIGFLPFLVGVFVYNKIQYGYPLATGYSGAGVFDLLPNYFFNYYLSPIRGALWWSPVIVLSLFGFFYMFHVKSREDREILLFSIINIFLFTVTISFYNRWWSGLSFGQRYLSPLVPFYFVGLCYLSRRSFLKNKRRWFFSLVGLFASYTFIMFLFYNINLNTRLGNEMLLKNDTRYNFVENIITPIKSYKTERTPFEKNMFYFIFNRVFGGNNSTIFYKIMTFILNIRPAELKQIKIEKFTKNEVVVEIEYYIKGDKNNFFLGIDVWGKPQIHPDTHLFWVNFKSLSNVKTGRSKGKIVCEFDLKKCEFILDNGILKMKDWWFNPKLDKIYRTKKVFNINILLYDNYRGRLQILGLSTTKT